MSSSRRPGLGGPPNVATRCYNKLNKLINCTALAALMTATSPGVDRTERIVRGDDLTRSLIVRGPAGGIEFSRLLGFDWHYAFPPYPGSEAASCYLGGTCYPEGGPAGTWRDADDDEVWAELERCYARMAAQATVRPCGSAS
jgi:hypothetical protein